MNERVLVIGAHPDDAELMAGGTIAKHVQSGDTVHVLILADGVTARASGDIGERMVMAKNAATILGCEVEALAYPDQRLDTIPILDIIQQIEKRIDAFKPTVVYTHFMGDMNKDHRITGEATQVACRPQPGCSVKTLLCGEVPSSTEWAGGFNPHWYSDISDVWHKKVEAINCYKTEIRNWPHPRSKSGILALAEYRGSSVGVELAEAFEVRRRIA